MRILIIALVLAGCAARPMRPTTTVEVPRIMRTKTVVFVHGMFVTPTCWKNWETYFQARGYRTLAPAWPEHDPPATGQRNKHPNPAPARVPVYQVPGHSRAVVKGLQDSPSL